MEALKASGDPNNPNDTETCMKPVVKKVWGCETRRRRREELTWCRLHAERPSSIEFTVI